MLPNRHAGAGLAARPQAEQAGYAACLAELRACIAHADAWRYPSGAPIMPLVLAALRTHADYLEYGWTCGEPTHLGAACQARRSEREAPDGAA